MSNLTFSVGVRLDIEVHEKLKAAAEADGRSLSGLIAKICSEWVVDNPAPQGGRAGQTPKSKARKAK